MRQSEIKGLIEEATERVKFFESHDMIDLAEMEKERIENLKKWLTK